MIDTTVENMALIILEHTLNKIYGFVYIFIYLIICLFMGAWLRSFNF